MGKQRLAYFIIIIIIIIIISGIITLSKEHFPFSYVQRFGNDNSTNEHTIEAQSEWAYNKSVEDAECERVFRRAGVAAGNCNQHPLESPCNRVVQLVGRDLRALDQLRKNCHRPWFHNERILPNPRHHSTNWGLAAVWLSLGLSLA